MRFSANISFLFGELPFADRFAAVADAGLDAVEFFWPEERELERIPDLARAAGVSIALFNFYAGEMAAGDRGLLSDAARAEEFRGNVPVALELARQVGCTRLNALVGTALDRVDRDQQLELATENVRWAADQAATQGAVIMIEAVNTFENGPYLLPRTEQALEFIDTVARPNMRLQYDAYHAQRMEGNLVATLRRHIDRIGHVQIADSPDRGEPGTGEIAYGFVLDQLDELGYDGYIGLEYRPRASTLDSLTWLEDYRKRAAATQ